MTESDQKEAKDKNGEYYYKVAQFVYPPVGMHYLEFSQYLHQDIILNSDIMFLMQTRQKRVTSQPRLPLVEEVVGGAWVYSNTLCPRRRTRLTFLMTRIQL